MAPIIFINPSQKKLGLNTWYDPTTYGLVPLLGNDKNTWPGYIPSSSVKNPVSEQLSNENQKLIKQLSNENQNQIK